ncbi:MAG: Site-specific recombinase XerD [Chloroflexi bacterium]|nr:Site-specific recombinase XerD [Chloroflexota bacterium]
MRPIQRRQRPLTTVAPPQPNQPVRWDDAVEEFIATQARRLRAQRTLDNHRWVLMGRVKEYADGHGLTTVDRWDAGAFEGFQHDLAEVTDAEGRPYSASTQHIHYRNLRQFLRFCVERGYLQDTSALTVRGPRLPRQLPRSLTPEEERRLLAVARAGAGRDGGRDGVLVELLLRCGLRPFEVIRLCVEDVFQTSKGDWLLRVYGKGHKERIVPLDTPRCAFSRVVLQYIDRQRPKDTRRHELFLSARRRGDDYQPLTASGVGQIIDRLCERSGLHGEAVKAYAYRLRHTFAMRALEAGAGPHEVRRAMGHETFAMTMRYLEATDDDLIAAWKRRSD